MAYPQSNHIALQNTHRDIEVFKQGQIRTRVLISKGLDRTHPRWRASKNGWNRQSINDQASRQPRYRLEV